MLTFRYHAHTALQVIFLGMAVSLSAAAIWAIFTGLPFRVFGVYFPPEISVGVYLGMVAAMVWLGGRAIIALAMGTREITLSPTTLCIPRGEFSKRTVELTPRQIQSINVGNAGRPNAAVGINYDSGRFVVSRAMFEEPHRFEEFVQAVQQFARPTAHPGSVRATGGDAPPVG